MRKVGLIGVSGEKSAKTFPDLSDLHTSINNLNPRDFHCQSNIHMRV
jgi:hypothetical protein